VSAISGELLLYLRFLTAGARHGQYLDVRWGRPDLPMRRRLISTAELGYAASLIAAHAPSCDVYVGASLRDGDRHGGKSAISTARMAYVECDASNAREAIAAFACPPTLEIESGTPGHLHAYWLLEGSSPPALVESINRGLAGQLGGDPCCAEIARILRPPGTFNHKHRPPRVVRMLAFRPAARYGLSELAEALPRAEPIDVRHSWADSARSFRRPLSELELELRAIPALEYVRVLTGAVPNRQGKILCPFHGETVPSFQLYADGTFFCFGSRCRRGGSIIQFAGHLWGLAPEFDLEQILNRLAECFALRKRA
jgi:CHC2 zinc finger